VVHKLFDKRLQKLCETLKRGPLTASLNKGGPRRPPRSPPLKSTPDYIRIKKKLIGSPEFGIYSLAFG